MKKGTVLASAVAGLFAFAAYAEDKAPAKDTKETASVNCGGVNECKGKGACSSAESSCAGQNACKGKGVLKISAKDCAEKKGKVVAAKKM